MNTDWRYVTFTTCIVERFETGSRIKMSLPRPMTVEQIQDYIAQELPGWEATKTD